MMILKVRSSLKTGRSDEQDFEIFWHYIDSVEHCIVSEGAKFELRGDEAVQPIGGEFDEEERIDRLGDIEFFFDNQRGQHQNPRYFRTARCRMRGGHEGRVVGIESEAYLLSDDGETVERL